MFILLRDVPRTLFFVNANANAINGAQPVRLKVN